MAEIVLLTGRRMQKLGMVRRRDLEFSDPNYSEDENPAIQYSLTLSQWEVAR